MTPDQTNKVAKFLESEEPIFIIRAQDAVGAHAVRAWAHLAAQAGAAESKVADAIAHAKVFEAWQAEHGTKVPD